jgi:polyphosphate glucokinase
MEVLGIDLGGSGIKGAPVDTTTGQLLEERQRVETPQPATPAAMAKALRQLVDSFQWRGPIGIGFPAIIRNQIVHTAANIDDSWIGQPGGKIFAEASGCPVKLLNDADAAGLAEVRFGAGRGQNGSLLILTLGTGIGSALFYQGTLFPNTEFGHIEMHGMAAEQYASAAVRKDEDLNWPVWGARLNEYLARMERLLAPDVIILGGGVSKKFEKFSRFLETSATLLPAQLLNEAGVIGAALAVTLD